MLPVKKHSKLNNYETDFSRYFAHLFGNSIQSPNTIVHAMPLFDLEKMQKEDAEMEGEEVPYRFGKGFDVSFSFDDGQWEDVESGRLWTISFKSEGAISLNFIIDDFYLPEGAKLYIENQDKLKVH